MPLGFHPDHYFAFPGEQAILLDVARDRYQRLSVAHSSALRALLADPLATDPAAADLLLMIGLLKDGLEARPLGLAAVPPTIHAPDDQARPHASPSLAASALTAAFVRYRLRRHGLKQSLADATRRTLTPRAADTATAIAVARRFVARRAWLPLSPACLPDGLTLHALLCRAGVAARLVIGVRDRPFAAHCWVQAGNVVLSDPPESVAELTPIFAL